MAQRGQSVTSRAELQSIRCPTLVLSGQGDHTGGDKRRLARCAANKHPCRPCIPRALPPALPPALPLSCHAGYDLFFLAL